MNALSPNSTIAGNAMRLPEALPEKEGQSQGWVDLARKKLFNSVSLPKSRSSGYSGHLVGNMVKALAKTENVFGAVTHKFNGLVGEIIKVSDAVYSFNDLLRPLRNLQEVSQSSKKNIVVRYRAATGLGFVSTQVAERLFSAGRSLFVRFRLPALQKDINGLTKNYADLSTKIDELEKNSADVDVIEKSKLDLMELDKKIGSQIKTYKSYIEGDPVLNKKVKNSLRIVKYTTGILAFYLTFRKLNASKVDDDFDENDHGLDNNV